LIGGQVGIVGHIEIAKGTKIQAQSGINKSIKKENEAFFGSPALLYNDFLKSNAVFKQLPELLKRLDSLEKKLKDL
jgi:UDP-3-O-[3-hydroxymyristoyl] glucosamine N-acyltransferase